MFLNFASSGKTNVTKMFFNFCEIQEVIAVLEENSATRLATIAEAKLSLVQLIEIDGGQTPPPP
jgi:hypothetical protein